MYFSRPASSTPWPWPGRPGRSWGAPSPDSRPRPRPGPARSWGPCPGRGGDAQALADTAPKRLRSSALGWPWACPGAAPAAPGARPASRVSGRRTGRTRPAACRLRLPVHHGLDVLAGQRLEVEAVAVSKSVLTVSGLQLTRMTSTRSAWPRPPGRSSSRTPCPGRCGWGRSPARCLFPVGGRGFASASPRSDTGRASPPRTRRRRCPRACKRAAGQGTARRVASSASVARQKMAI